MNTQIRLDQELSVDEKALKAAILMGDGLKNHPDFQAFWELALRINADVRVQDLARQIQQHQSAFQTGSGDAAFHSQEIDRLEKQMNSIPLVQDYSRAEKKARDLFRAVDEIISQAAGVPFAVNARRSGCCG